MQNLYRYVVLICYMFCLIHFIFDNDLLVMNITMGNVNTVIICPIINVESVYI